MYQAAIIELERTRTTASDKRRANPAEELLQAASEGWQQVVRLLESHEPDPKVREMLRGLLEA